MKRLLTYVLILTFLLCSCGGRQDSRLAEADRVMEEHPDSALAILEAIDTATLKGEDNRALHALLLTQALRKNHVVIYDDSLISRAYDYYSQHGPSPELMKVLFYKGDIAQHRNELVESMSFLMQSESMARKFESKYWQAKSLELIGDQFEMCFNSGQRAKYALHASELYAEAGRTDNQRYALIDYASGLGYSGYYDRAMKIIDSLLSIARKENDIQLTQYCVGTKFPQMFDNGKFKEARSFLDSVSEEEASLLFRPVVLSRIASLYLDDDDEEIAKAYLQLCDSLPCETSDSVALLQTWKDYYKKAGDTKNVINLGDSLVNIMNREMEYALKESAMSTQRDYYQEEVFREKEKTRDLSILLTIISVSAIMVVSAGIMMYNYKTRAKRAELEAAWSEMKRLSEEIGKKESDILQRDENIRKECSKILKDKYIELENLFKLVEKKDESGEDYTINTWKAQDWIEALRSENVMSMLEKYVDDKNDGLIGKLRINCDFLRPDDIKLLCLNLTGLQTGTCAFILNVKRKTYYMRRSRLISRLKEHEFEGKAELIRLLS